MDNLRSDSLRHFLRGGHIPTLGKHAIMHFCILLESTFWCGDKTRMIEQQLDEKLTEVLLILVKKFIDKT